MAYYDHNRRRGLYTAARAWVNFPDDDEVKDFMRRVANIEDQGFVKTTATEQCVRSFRLSWKEQKKSLKTGDVVLFSAKLKRDEPIQYKALQAAQEEFSVQSKADSELINPCKMTALTLIFFSIGGYRNSQCHGISCS